MLTRKLFPILSALALASCATVNVPNTRMCAVAGRLSAGMDCAYTLNDKTESMTMAESLDFLEPQLTPERGPAVCMASADWAKIKTVIEQACGALGRKCTKEVKDAMQSVSDRVTGLQALSISKRRGKK